MESGSTLDLEHFNRGVWLVKVPKYVAERWERAPGDIEVAKLRLTKSYPKKTEVTLSLSKAAMALKEPGERDIPKEHSLDVQQITHQVLGVFSQRDEPKDDKLCLEGKIVQKLECRPPSSMVYMQLKQDAMKKASTPKRQVQQLDRVVQNYKPVSDHKNNIEYNKKKKEEGKRQRGDKNYVLEKLFGAFEKHQYYTLKDLLTITGQPIGYLKEILKEVCDKSFKNSHRNMWELKPEYRHYDGETNNDEAKKF